MSIALLWLYQLTYHLLFLIVFDSTEDMFGICLKYKNKYQVLFSGVLRLPRVHFALSVSVKGSSNRAE